MHVVQGRLRQQRQRRVNLPSERMVVNGVGLGELDGMFNIGKMFTRMFTFTPSSFKLKNIAGTIGATVTTIGTGGIANIASEVLGSSGLKVVKGGFTSTHSKPMQYVGYGTMAAAAAAGAYYGGSALLSKSGVASGAGTTASSIPVGTGTVLAPASVPVGTGTVLASSGTTAGGFLSTAGNWLSNIGSGLSTVMKALPVVSALTGGGGGGQQQQQQEQGGMTQAEFDAQQRAAYEAGIRQQQQEELYRQQVLAQQSQMMPVSYGGQPSMQTSYGDLRSPYTAITEDGQQVQVDPLTGNVIQPEMPTDMLVGAGVLAAVAAGLYLIYSKE